MTYIDGAVPLLFVAPHGGRRPADAPILDSIKVNDLHTVELTTELATRTRGYALINHSCDRNELDLNRISQVRTQAPWFLAALEELLSTLVEQHGAARVFFIHGWNVVQPVCDLGTGFKQRGEKIVPANKAAAPTLSTHFFSQHLLPFRDAALAQGIDVALGRRYPAADKNNVMQLFSHRFAEDRAPQIRTLAQLSVNGQVNAVQFELGVGLRWPGRERERFVTLFSKTLGRVEQVPHRDTPEFSTLTFSLSRPAENNHRNGAPLLLHHPTEPVRFGLHFHDPVSGLGLMGGIERLPSEPTCSGRLLLFLGGTEMVLFTGEDDAVADPHVIRVGGLRWQTRPDGFAISYHGSIMRFAHPEAFVRLEEGLAASWTEPASISLTLKLPSPLPSPAIPLFLSHLSGEVWLRDRRYPIDAWGFLDLLKAEETGRLLPRRLLSLPFGPDLGIFLYWVETLDGPRSSGIVYHDGIPHPLGAEEWKLAYSFHQGRPTAFQLSLSQPTLLRLDCQGETVVAIPIVRHAVEGSALSVTFGLARTIWQGREARGVYEISERRKDSAA
jgi:hypothetical protein